MLSGNTMANDGPGGDGQAGLRQKVAAPPQHEHGVAGAAGPETAPPQAVALAAGNAPLAAVLAPPPPPEASPPPPDVLSPALLMHLQRAAGNGAVAELAQRNRDPTTAAAVEAFHQAVAAEKTRIATEAKQHQQTLRSSATEMKRHINAGVESEAIRLTQAHGETVAQVQAAMQNGRAQVTGQKEAKARETAATADQQMAALDKVIADRQAEMRQAGETKAQSAEQLGEMQAQRALTGTHERAARALLLGSQKAAQYQGYKRAPDIAETAGKMAQEAVPGIMQSGNELSATVRKDTGELGAKFRREAADAAAGFKDNAPAARKKIEQERDQTVGGINRMADDSANHLDSSGHQLIGQHQQTQQAATTQLRALASAARAAIERSTATALSKIDQEAASTTAKLERFETDIATAVTRAWPWVTRQQLEAAKGHATAVADGFVAGLGGMTGQLIGGIRQAGTHAGSRFKGHVDQLVAPVRNAGSDFETQSAQGSAQVTQKIDDTTAQSTQNMRTTVGEVDTRLQGAITQSEEKWQGQLQEGIASITKKVDAGLAQQDQALAQLSGKIDEKAQEIEHQSFWNRALQFAGGFFTGFFKELWSIVKGILIIALVVIAIVLVAALLILIFGGLGALLGVILAVSLFVAAYAGVIGTILAIVGVIALVVVLAIAAYHVYEAITRKDLTDWQRGELVGGSTADVASILVPEALLGRLSEASKAARAVEGAEDATQLARLRALVPDEAELERLVQLSGGDGSRLERLLAETGKDPARLERLLKATRGDEATLQRLLGEVDGNAGRLDDVLAANGGDLGKAEAFLEKTPAELLQEIMGPDRFQEYREAIEAIKAEHPELAGVPDEQLIAIRGYTSDDYAMLNKALREKDVKELARLKPYIESATGGLKQFPSYSGTVLRGESGTIANYLGKEGQVVTFDAFMSTDKVRAFSGDVELAIESRTGKEIDLISHYKGTETEVLFPPGSQFKIVDVTEISPGKFRVQLLDVSG
jgi:hypothetical protein